MPRLVVHVVDEFDGSPIRDAIVTVDGRREITDRNGTAVFDLPKGTYTIEVRGQIIFPSVTGVNLTTDKAVEIRVSKRTWA